PRLRALLAYTTLCALCAALATPLLAQNATTAYEIDPGHSSAQFTVKHLLISNVRGIIPIKEGQVETAPGSSIPVSLAATLDVTGVNTQNADRDKDLRGPDWFDVAKYPTIEFKSTGITSSDPNSFKVTGNLTLHGVTKSITLDGKVDGSVADRRGHEHVGYSATTSIDRRDFGMTALNAMGGALVAGTNVAISLEVEAVAR
ncbi:MAG TPA: YceI family protein, partial [Candidatus Baltobacteraceae bacterium]|nr:YceI family protein [Candidatus Baltobacteraceae bacterium]